MIRRYFLLTVALVAFSSFVSNRALATPVSPEIFVGQYELTKSHEGLCDSNILVNLTVLNSGSVDLHIGGFSFVKINEGPQLLDDELVKLSWNSYTTVNSEAIEHRELVTKSSQTKSVRNTVARLQDNKLHVKSHTRSTSPGEPAIEFGTECVYQKQADSLL